VLERQKPWAWKLLSCRLRLPWPLPQLLSACFSSCIQDVVIPQHIGCHINSNWHYIALDKVSLQMEADDLNVQRFVEFVFGTSQNPSWLGYLLIMATHFSIYELTTENSQLLPVCIILNLDFQWEDGDLSFLLQCNCPWSPLHLWTSPSFMMDLQHPVVQALPCQSIDPVIVAWTGDTW